MNKQNFMLTTSDNPWNPFTNFTEWMAFDEAPERRYCTNGLIARFLSVGHEESEQEQEDDRVRAIKRVLELFPFGPIGFENDPKNDGILYALIYEDGNVKKQNEIDLAGLQ